jgi:gas vesicle protein
VAKKGRYFIFGSIIGAIIALLFAPKSGKESREFILNKTRDAVNNPEEFKKNIKDKIKDIVENLSEYDEIIEPEEEIIISKMFEEEECEK